MKVIPFYKIKYRINLKTEEELEKILYDFIKPDTLSTEFLVFANSDKQYDGELDTTKKEFTLIRNYGTSGGSNIMQAKGCYSFKDKDSEIILTVRPDYFWLSLPFLLLIVGFIFGNNIWGPFVIFIASYFLICIIPANITGQRMTQDLYSKLRRHLIETVDLATGILKF